MDAFLDETLSHHWGYFAIFCKRIIKQIQPAISIALCFAQKILKGQEKRKVTDEHDNIRSILLICYIMENEYQKNS